MVLGLIAGLEGKYYIRSNRESGFGRYDVMMEPVDKERTAYILEFKVFHPRKEKTLEESGEAGFKQIQEKGYAQELVGRGFSVNQIQSYVFVFEGKRVLIKEG